MSASSVSFPESGTIESAATSTARSASEAARSASSSAEIDSRAFLTEATSEAADAAADAAAAFSDARWARSSSSVGPLGWPGSWFTRIIVSTSCFLVTRADPTPRCMCRWPREAGFADRALSHVGRVPCSTPVPRIAIVQKSAVVVGSSCTQPETAKVQTWPGGMGVSDG